jgi:hypothetical protein
MLGGGLRVTREDFLSCVVVPPHTHIFPTPCLVLKIFVNNLCCCAVAVPWPVYSHVVAQVADNIEHPAASLGGPPSFSPPSRLVPMSLPQ